MSVTLTDVEMAIRDALEAEAMDAMNAEESAAVDADAPQPMTESEVQSAVKQMLANSSGGDDSHGNREGGHLSLALDYYFGRNRGDEQPGRSTQQSLDVADMVEAVLAETTPILSNHTLVSFTAINEDDEDQAQTESQIVNHVIMQQNQGYLLLYTSIKDALLQKNGVIEVFVEEKFDVQIEEYDGLSEIEIAQALQPKSETEEVYLDDEAYEEDGSKIRIKRVTTRNKLKCEPVAPEDFKYYAGQNSTNLEDCPFSARRRIVLRSDLLLEGYDPETVNRCRPYSGRTDQTSRSRDQYNETDRTHYDSVQKATDPIEVWTCYAQLDEDDDGVAELRRIIVAGSDAYEILEDIPWTVVPFAAGTPYIQGHRFLGLSLFDKLWDVQDGKTTILRQYEDNLENGNNRRIAVDQNLVDDWDPLLNSRPAGVVPTDGPPSQVLMPIPVDDIGPSCIQALDYYDKIAARRAGATLELQTRGQAISGNIGSQGLDRLMSAEEQMAAMMARNLGETLIRNLYLLVHRVLRANFAGQVSAKVGPQWVQQVPSQWRSRDEISVIVGMSGTERARRMGVLSTVLQQQLQMLQGGADGVLVDEAKIHNTLVDFADTGNLSNPDRYWIDPESQEAMQAKKQKAMQAQQAQQQAAQHAQVQGQLIQAEVTKAQAQLMRVQMQGQIEHLKTQLKAMESQQDATEAQQQLQLDYLRLIDQHSKWLTELEAQQGRDYSAQAFENATGMPA